MHPLEISTNVGFYGTIPIQASSFNVETAAYKLSQAAPHVTGLVAYLIVNWYGVMAADMKTLSRLCSQG